MRSLNVSLTSNIYYGNILFINKNELLMFNFN